MKYNEQQLRENIFTKTTRREHFERQIQYKTHNKTFAFIFAKITLQIISMSISYRVNS